MLGIIRRGQPITATEIIEELATMKGISSDSGSFQKFKDAVKSTIRRQKKQGLIVETNTENKVSAWSVA